MASEEVSGEELTALVQAIKFAHPGFTLKQVHSQVLTHGGKFATVPLARVKKYLKKLGLMGNLAVEAEADSKPVSLMTVGGESKSSVSTGASASSSLDESHWMAVPLDVPAMQLEAYPHQAVIRMTEATAAGLAEGSLGEIYKIQKAMSEGDEQYPMLMYNKDRSRKTFVQPTSPAYAEISRWIDTQGASGIGGGTKAYFYGRVQGKDTVFVNVHTLADAQPW
ncbi:unnamed protein product [Aphanomyces euteiches]|uniref:Uncharacterized protein n=1 Tax=Aphanomyces euteiches TaxID=100861 RepID=A0A6G0XMD3_9STRA|nr:hypothetical protein Ae201684_003470 [Aphanomyces euteiches]KAH9098233.1 hypothetical protein Ae201684P_017450 [Aphanomyces euteiches]KAH9155322.1 hypothetical protein AeRB84_002688 [Aphanomyces euteiches]